MTEVNDITIPDGIDDDTRIQINDLLANSTALIDIDAAYDAITKTLDGEITTVEEFYAEVKSHWDKVKLSSETIKRGIQDFNTGIEQPVSNAKPLSFLHQQGKNLIDIRRLKLELIKEKTAIITQKVALQQKQLSLVARLLTRANKDDD